MALTPGTRLGAFEILALIGSGGMGEVYRARDTRLARDVALKLLPFEFTKDPERLARFTREAQTLAALNHPHIAHIYGLETVGEHQFLAMELIDGESLDVRLARGRLPVNEALALATQIAGALEAAHDKGIVHRDLKPANIALTLDGQAKVLDFGLAKTVDQTSSPPGLRDSPTITSPALVTGVGVLLGTAAYMAPEQAKGRGADKRADVWAFGCVLFEMLTGVRAFGGDDVADTLANVLKSEPDWTLLPADVHPQIVRLLRGCLDKNRTTRIPEAAVARFLLEEPAGKTAAVSRTHRTASMVAAVALVMAAAAAAAAWWANAAPGPSPVVRFSVDTTLIGLGSYFRDLLLTPDGETLVYLEQRSFTAPQLMVRPLNQLEARPLEYAGAAQSIFMSPDGKWVGFGTAGELKKIPLGGGAAETICRIPGQLRGATWGSDNTIVFATANRSAGLLEVAANGGEPRTIAAPNDDRHEYRWPAMLPGGGAVVFTIAPGAVPTSLTSQIAVLDRKTGRTTVVMTGTAAEYSDTGHLVYAVGDTLRAIRFDLKRLETAGESISVADHINVKFTGAANYAVGRGVLAYVPARRGASVAARDVVWVDRTGREEAINVPPHAYVYARLSPDGTRIALTARDQDQDIWSWDIARQTLTRLTADPSLDTSPVWTPDSRRIVFASQRAGVANLFAMSPDGAANAERLTRSLNPQVPTSVSPDARHVVAWGPSEQNGVDLIDVDVSSGTSRTLMHNGFNLRGGEVSPDGHWLAYHSDESGRNEVYVRPFPNVEGARWLISRNGGDTPAWSADGRELFYFDATGALTAVPVTIGSAFSAGVPAKILEPNYVRPYATAGVNGRSYDIARDGRRFVVIKENERRGPDRATTPVVLVLHWNDDLR